MRGIFITVFLGLLWGCSTPKQREWKASGSRFSCEPQVFNSNSDIIIPLPLIPKCNKNLNVYSSYFNREVSAEKCQKEVLRYSYDLFKWEDCRKKSIIETYYDMRNEVIETMTIVDNLRRIYRKKAIPVRLARKRWRDRTFAGRTECSSMPMSQCQFQLEAPPRCLSLEHATFEEESCIFQVKAWMEKLRLWKEKSLKETSRYAFYRYNSEIERILSYKGIAKKKSFRDRAQIIFAYPRRK